jgi:hypothetical protein
LGRRWGRRCRRDTCASCPPPSGAFRPPPSGGGRGGAQRPAGRKRRASSLRVVLAYLQRDEKLAIRRVMRRKGGRGGRWQPSKHRRCASPRLRTLGEATLFEPWKRPHCALGSYLLDSPARQVAGKFQPTRPSLLPRAPPRVATAPVDTKRGRVPGLRHHPTTGKVLRVFPVAPVLLKCQLEKSLSKHSGQAAAL